QAGADYGVRHAEHVPHGIDPRLGLSRPFAVDDDGTATDRRLRLGTGRAMLSSGQQVKKLQHLVREGALILPALGEAAHAVEAVEAVHGGLSVAPQPVEQRLDAVGVNGHGVSSGMRSYTCQMPSRTSLAVSVAQSAR